MVRSTITTESAPGGITAPVIIRTASPGPTPTSGGTPAGKVPTTTSSTGGPTVSTERTANPSMAVLSKGGTSPMAIIGSAVTRPRAPSNPTRAATGVGQRSRMWARASWSWITGRGYPPPVDQTSGPQESSAPENNRRMLP